MEGDERGNGEQEDAHMDNLEDYVELLYEGKDKVGKAGECSKR